MKAEGLLPLVEARMLEKYTGIPDPPGWTAEGLSPLAEARMPAKCLGARRTAGGADNGGQEPLLS